MRHILLSFSPLFFLELGTALYHFTILLYFLLHLLLRHDFSTILSPLSHYTPSPPSSSSTSFASVFLLHLPLPSTSTSSIFLLHFPSPFSSFIFIFFFPFFLSLFSDMVSQLSGLNTELEDEKGFNQIVTEKQDKRVETLVRQNVHLQVRHYLHYTHRHTYTHT